LVETSAAPLKASEYWALLERVPDPASLLGLSAADVARVAAVDPSVAERVAQLIAAASGFAFELDQAEQSGLRAIASVDDDYPVRLCERLGRSAPPLLYVAGDPMVLTSPLLGVVGSRDVDASGAEVARTTARAAASHQYGIVSGGAKGVDRLAMQAALEAGAPVLAVLADSLARTSRDPEIRRAVTDGQLCLCTPFKPTAGFTVANAMARNKLIYALSSATLVVASDLEKGCTWAGAVEALRQRTAPVLVWTGEGRGPGNGKLVELGASPLDDVDRLFPLPDGSSADAASESSVQLALEI
jgi:predicted Rossmann fold nucleotide-binding protein DprA/Smf involved in DNA uptake